jgi:small-conductance mechanosensitive channel
MKISDLTAQLQQESNETTEEIKRIERDALSRFESDLKRQCSSAATTLKSALDVSRTELVNEIETYKTGLKDAISADSKELTDQLAILKKDVAKWTPKLTLAVKLGIFLPIAMTLAACSLMIVTTWLWMPRELWNVRTSHQTMWDGRSYLVIDDPTWINCNLADDPKKASIVRPCKTIETTNPNQ